MQLCNIAHLVRGALSTKPQRPHVLAVHAVFDQLIYNGGFGEGGGIT